MQETESEEEEEEIADLNVSKGLSANSADDDDDDDEQYDLTAEDANDGGRVGKRSIQALLAKGGRKAVSRKRLPEAASDNEDNDSDSSLNFADMESRVSDDGGSGDEGFGKKRRKKAPKNGEDESGVVSKAAAKRNKRQAQVGDYLS